MSAWTLKNLEGEVTAGYGDPLGFTALGQRMGRQWMEAVLKVHITTHLLVTAQVMRHIHSTKGMISKKSIVHISRARFRIEKLSPFPNKIFNLNWTIEKQFA